jgi:hypothetical protein
MTTLLSLSALGSYNRQFTAMRLRILLDSCEHMLHDVRSLRRNEFECVEYGESATSAPHISRFLGVDIVDTMKRFFRPTKKQRYAHIRLKRSGLAQTANWKSFEQCHLQVKALCQEPSQFRA